MHRTTHTLVDKRWRFATGAGRLSLAMGLFAVALPGAAHAQPAKASIAQNADDPALDTAAATGTESDEIVVTGTLLRNAAPVGSNLIAVGAERIQSQGATTSNELLATIPQVSNLFNTVPGSRLNIAPNQIQVVRPNLRNLSPETGSSSSTLVLFDGHRIAGVGVTQSAVDPDLIPTGAIERVEVVTDGGSATYGADAVGGVINFITRKRFDGVLASGRYGFADNYYTADASLTVGTDWGEGSLFAAYTYQRNDAIFGRDRDFITQRNFTTNTPTGRQCNPGNVTLTGATYALPGLTTPNSFNSCDNSDDASFVPSTERHGALVGLHQELTDSIQVDLKAFYGRRESTSYTPFRGVATVTPANAFYRPIAANPRANQSVDFTFAPVLGTNTAEAHNDFEEWGVNAEFKADLNDNFQVRQLLNYSQSASSFKIAELNQLLLAAAGSSANPQAAVNFYNPAATPNAAVIAAIANGERAGLGKNELTNLRTIVDGRLFTLPGGEVRVAAGYEYIYDNFYQRVSPPNGLAGAVGAVPYTQYNRSNHAVFGEVQVPIFGEDNRTGGLYALTLSGSVRYDHFSDFGGTTNPKVGVTYKPVRWLALRGNYSTSFNAPSPVDQLGSLRNTISFFPFNAFVRPGENPAANGVSGTVSLQGATPNLRPQTARIYSFGTDLELPFVDGFRASVNYYNVRFKDLLGIPTPNTGIFTNFPDNVTTNAVTGLTPAQLRAFAALAPNGPAIIEPLIASGRRVYETVNFLTSNYGTLKVDGLDFAASYQLKTGFGGIDLSSSGNYTLNRKSRSGPASAEVDQLDFTRGFLVSRLQLQALLGTDIGRFRAQATLNHSSGFRVVRSATLPQDRVRDFNTVNLFFKYDVPGESMLLRNLSLTLNVNNVFDQDPPLYRLSTDNGYANGFTLGRLFQFGISKRF